MKKSLHILGILFVAIAAFGQSSTSTGALNAPEVNGVVNAAQESGADATRKINACLLAATAAGGTGICDARSLGSALTFTSNAFANVTSPFTLLLAQNTQAKVDVTQTIVAPGSTIEAPNVGQAPAPGGVPHLWLKWDGKPAGTVLDVKDAQSLTLDGVGVSCGNGSGPYAAHGILMSGGYTNTFYDVFRDVEVENCNYGGEGANSVGIDDATVNSYSVTMTNNGRTVSGTVVNGSFPSFWVGKTLKEVEISNASDPTFDFNPPLSSLFVTIQFTVTSATAFTGSAPKSRSPYWTWNPDKASGITATLSSFAGMQDWYCYNCILAQSETNYASRWPLARFFGGIIDYAGTYGFKADQNASASFFGTTFTGDETDIWLAGNGTRTNFFGGWMEQSPSSGNGVLAAASGVRSYSVNFYGTFMQSHALRGFINLQNAGAGTVNFIGTQLNASTVNKTIDGNSAVNIGEAKWDTPGESVTPTYKGIVFGPATISFLAAASIAGSQSVSFSLSGWGTGATAKCVTGYKCTQFSGTVEIAAGTSPSAGANAMVKWETPLARNASCVFGQSGIPATSDAAVRFYGGTPTSFAAHRRLTPTAGKTYAFTYMCGD